MTADRKTGALLALSPLAVVRRLLQRVNQLAGFDEVFTRVTPRAVVSLLSDSDQTATPPGLVEVAGCLIGGAAAVDSDDVRVDGHSCGK